MSADTIAVRIYRPLHFRGVVHQVGEIIHASPLTAKDLISTGSARLVDLADLGVIVDAENAGVRRQSSSPLPCGWMTW